MLEATQPVLILFRLVVDRDDVVTLFSECERLAINAHAAADLCRVAPFDLSADDEHIAVDARGASNQHVGVHGEHVTANVSGDDQRSVEHRDVSRNVARFVDLETISRAGGRRPVPPRDDFPADVARKRLSSRRRVSLRAGGDRHDREEQR
jgi:hypothetical protein